MKGITADPVTDRWADRPLPLYMRPLGSVCLGLQSPQHGVFAFRGDYVAGGTC